MKYKVSFCIPSYNNKEAVVKMVENLLNCNRDDIQIVICDDASTDNTGIRLRQFNDSRLKVIINNCNIGAHRNWSRAMAQADGVYAYLVMGRDYLNLDHIDKLLRLLDEYEKRDIKLALDRKNDNGKSICIYEDQLEALCRFVGFEHPTGLIIKKDVLSELREKTQKFFFDTTYPENFIKKELIKEYKVATGYTGVFTDTEIISLSKLESKVEKIKNFREIYFSPFARTHDAIIMIEMVKVEMPAFKMGEEEFILYAERIIEKLYDCLISWKNLCERVDWMRHYGLSRIMITKEDCINAIDESVGMLKEKFHGEYEIDLINKYKNRYITEINHTYSEVDVYRSGLKLRWFQECIKSVKSEKLEKCFEGKNVVLYGFGEIGQGLLSLLRNSGINIVGIIDKECNHFYSKESIFPDIESCPGADIIIITPFIDTSQIQHELSKKTEAELISAEELIYKL